MNMCFSVGTEMRGLKNVEKQSIGKPNPSLECHLVESLKSIIIIFSHRKWVLYQELECIICLRPLGQIKTGVKGKIFKLFTFQLSGDKRQCIGKFFKIIDVTRVTWTLGTPDQQAHPLGTEDRDWGPSEHGFSPGKWDFCLLMF